MEKLLAVWKKSYYSCQLYIVRLTDEFIDRNLVCEDDLIMTKAAC